MSYSFEKAVNYAFKYYENPNPDYRYFKVYEYDGGDCTNFVSQCLLAGGIEMVKDDIAPWWYNTENHTYSPSWVLSNSLYNTIKSRSQKSDVGPRAIEVDNLNQLNYGDLIFYRNKKNVINHVAIVTAFFNGSPLITQHSPDVVNISYYKPQKTRMHFIKILK
ncbi:MAG: hypothetical protein K0Q49_332 [Haloplasmataceae bacterium]|jgi:hypothetical protein|nr:hypothetical protein [Haloplasmataceae bacterium]